MNDNKLKNRKIFNNKIKNLKFFYMLGYIVYETLEELSKAKELSQIQNIFTTLISELADYLKLQPICQDITIKLLDKENFTRRERVSILDFGVRKIIQNNNLVIQIDKTYKRFLPFILLREAYYSFVPKEASELVKICINQIVENNLSKLSVSKEWENLTRDSLVDSDFLDSQFDKLQKFFKIEAKEPFENTLQFFFKEMRDKALLSHDGNIDKLYDVLFESYEYKTSRSLFNKDIVETLRILIKLFYENKSYIHLSDYQALFKKFKENHQIETDLSLRKFNESLQWINKCTSIAPTYDVSRSIIDLYQIIGIIKFNPILEKNKIKTLMEVWPFYQNPKFSENSFATEISLYINVPKAYLNDLLKYFDRLEALGYIIKTQFYRVLNKTSNINLNYYTDIININRIIDPNNIKYEKKYEIETIIEFPTISRPLQLSIFDCTILERVRYLSVTGLTFDKRVETLNAIKEDVENELRKQIIINKKFNKSLDKVLNSAKLKQQFLWFLNENLEKMDGFFYLHEKINKIVSYLYLIEKILKNNPDISNIYQLQAFLNTSTVFKTIKDHLLIRNKNIKKIVFHETLPLYFQSKNIFRKEVEKIQVFCNVFNACYDLKILDLKELRRIVQEGKVEDSSIAEEIYRKREKKYENVFKSVSSYKITKERMESTIDAFLNHNPPLIQPILINTILASLFAKYYPFLVLKDTPETHEKLNKLRIYFPKVFIWEMLDLTNKKSYISLLIYLVNLKEKDLFLSILYTYFKDSIITINRYFWRGVERTSLIPKDFYDFENKQFFYVKGLFNQLYTYSQKILGEILEWPKYQLNDNIQEIFWSTKQNMDTLIKTVKHRISHQKIEFNLRELDDMSEFKKNLETNLLDRAKFIDVKAKKFFKRYIKSIKFLPAFQKIGFSQYYLYFRPFYYRSPTFEIDFRLLFINTFQNIKYPACIEPNTPIICKYIFPFGTPNKTYLNWLVKSKKNVFEYCLFYKKKFYDIFHFNRNLTNEGWNYSSIRFKSYMQDVLFNPTYNPKISGIREFDINEKSEPDIYGPETQEYESLTQIYNIHSIDVKSYLGTRNYSIINNITELLQKKLIFPYLSLKNLDFQEKISIILPNIKQDLNDEIIKIFGFFNVCRIYEIEGEYFIYGFEDIKPFKNGLLIEIWFPKCEVDEFFEIFDLLFQFFNVKYRLILSDLVNGNTLLKSIYGNLDFLNSYNPLLNLKWNEKDKIWMNHTLFNEKFEPIYPDLILKKKDQV